MPKILGSKRHRANLEVMPKEAVTADQAVSALKKFKGPKFDQTVNVCMHLGIDPKQADQALRGSIALPRGIGKTKRVVAFCQSDKVQAALGAGAVKAGGEELVAEIEKGWMDFDVAVASPDMMRVIAKLGRVLGPKGLMPSPNAEAGREYSAGKVEDRADTGGNIHAVIGKMSFSESDLRANLEHFIKAIEKAKPPTSKGVYIRKITVSGAMTQIRHVAEVVA
jgi:large subunit ribosomal protein L1